MKHADLSGQIIGCSMKVHRTLGLRFQEYIYQRALEIELKRAGIRFVREYEMPIFYTGEKIGIRIVDFYVEEKIMVELKAVADLNEIHFAQTFNYIEASGIEIALLINFGSKSLQFKRLHHRKLSSSSPNNLA